MAKDKTSKKDVTDLLGQALEKDKYLAPKQEKQGETVLPEAPKEPENPKAPKQPGGGKYRIKGEGVGRPSSKKKNEDYIRFSCRIPAKVRNRLRSFTTEMKNRGVVASQDEVIEKALDKYMKKEGF